MHKLIDYILFSFALNVTKILGDKWYRLLRSGVGGLSD